MFAWKACIVYSRYTLLLGLNLVYGHPKLDQHICGGFTNISTTKAQTVWPSNWQISYFSVSAAARWASAIAVRAFTESQQFSTPISGSAAFAFATTTVRHSVRCTIRGHVVRGVARTNEHCVSTNNYVYMSLSVWSLWEISLFRGGLSFSVYTAGFLGFLHIRGDMYICCNGRYYTMYILKSTAWLCIWCCMCAMLSLGLPV